MPNWDEIRNEWETSKITLKDLAEQHNVKLGTLKSRKSRERWSKDATIKDATNSKKVATPKKHGGQPGNRGNPNPTPKFAKRNKAALKHGLFAKHLPEETLELVEHFQQEDQITKLKRNIAIQEANIIRSQKIMHVEDKDELIKHLKRVQSGKIDSSEWEFQYAWDRQGNYLNSLSRAMSTLMGMYKTLAELQGDDQDDVQSTIGFFVDALDETAEEVWDDEEEE